MKIIDKTVAELSQLLINKEITSLELTEAYLERIKSVDEEIGAFITVDVDDALEKAAQVDKDRKDGKQLSRLAGIPIAIKDNINVKDGLTTAASRVMANFRSPYDATVVERIKENDMVIIGKLNMDELAIGTSGETSYFRVTKNPWNTDYVPGGSSSGSAAALAAREVPLALGTDTGGSVRVPSAFCGVVGLKPTYGSISRYGAVAVASSFDQIGPMGNSVKDVAMLYDILKGNDPKDAVSTTEKLDDVTPKLDKGVKGLRIGIPEQYFGSSASDEVLNSVNSALKELEKQGAELVPLSFESAEKVIAVYYVVSSAEISSNLGKFDGVLYGYRHEEYNEWEDMFVKSRSFGFGAEVQRRIMLGTYVLQKEQMDTHFNRAKSWQIKIAEEVKAMFEKCDIIACPTTPKTAFSLGTAVENPPSTYGTDLATAAANITGLPAVSVPCGIGENNLPIGIQFVGKHFCEGDILAAAYEYEKLVGGFKAAEISRGDK